MYQNQETLYAEVINFSWPSRKIKREILLLENDEREINFISYSETRSSNNNILIFIENIFGESEFIVILVIIGTAVQDLNPQWFVVCQRIRDIYRVSRLSLEVEYLQSI